MADQKKFKELEDELSAILNRIENSQYNDLDLLLKDYDTGKKLISELEKRLETAKNQIKKANT